MLQTYKKIYTAVWNEIFPGFNPLTLEELKEYFAKDINLPVELESAFGGEQVFLASEYGYKKVMTPGQELEKEALCFWKKSKQPVDSLQSALSVVKDIAVFKGSRSVNSQDVYQSDDIYSSNLIYQSSHIYNSQKMVYCYNVKTSEYMIISKGSADSSFGIAIFDSGGISKCFDMHWCGKSLNSYFCHDCSDLVDCMFCFHTSSRQYCIANMQFEKEEYFIARAKILTDYFNQLSQPSAFRSIKDI